MAREAVADSRKSAGKMRLQMSRRQVLALGGAGASAVALAACGSDASSAGDTSQFGDGDIGILNYLLTVEYAEAAFYKAALRTSLLDEPAAKQARATMAKFGQQEDEHVAAMAKAVERLDGDPVEKPETTFPLKTTEEVLKLGTRLENLGAAAYLGQVPRIENPAALATVLSIHTVEGRHAAKMTSLLGGPLTPEGAFAKPASSEATLASLEPFLVD